MSDDQRPPARCQGCSRQPSKASGFRWCWWCDPTVPEPEKLAARQLGGRRGALAPAEVALLLDGTTLAPVGGRQGFRERLMAARAENKITGALYRDLLTGVDGASRDAERHPVKPAPKPIVVEMQRVNGTGGGEAA